MHVTCPSTEGLGDQDRLVSSFSVELVSERYEHPATNRPEGTFILVFRGLITFEVAHAMWIVPPQCALWIPGGLERSVRGVGDLEVHALFIAPVIGHMLPADCCTMSVSPLLRELVMAASRLPATYTIAGPEGRLIDVMLDVMAKAPIERLCLPMPRDARLRRIADQLSIDPADRATIATWARRIAMSERSLLRLLVKETGMSFGRWRQQHQIMRAIERLSEGQSVNTVAFELGYESASAFITMFKKTMGKPPGRYLAARRGHLLPGEIED